MTEQTVHLDTREWAVLTFVQAFAQRNCCAPTWEEIRVGCGYHSSGAVHNMMLHLADAGVLVWHTRKARTIAVLTCRVAVMP